jgi:murein DD-endopeptidase MepM/ murein hydrolase activator NlpD
MLVEALKKITDCFVLDSSIPYEAYCLIDLSIDSELLTTKLPKTADDYIKLIEDHLKSNNAQVAFGGYMERRNLYQRSHLFNDNLENERNIHIGLDLWINKPVAILAALDGEVVSLQNNAGLGDYGPTVILKHILNKCEFYTLYGHLSLKSLKSLQIGQKVKKGEKIAVLGEPSENGDYAPHLHFQLIQSLGEYAGDYPGVCNKNDVSFYQENCPDPNLLLKINDKK